MQRAPPLRFCRKNLEFQRGSSAPEAWVRRKMRRRIAASQRLSSCRLESWQCARQERPCSWILCAASNRICFQERARGFCVYWLFRDRIPVVMPGLSPLRFPPQIENVIVWPPAVSCLAAHHFFVTASVTGQFCTVILDCRRCCANYRL